MMPGQGRGGQGRSYRAMGLAWQIGASLVAAIFVGWLIGQWLDRVFHTSPWLMLVFTLFGVAAGFIELIRIANRIASEEEQAGKDD